jgi:PPM family protein phosphatase
VPGPSRSSDPSAVHCPLCGRAVARGDRFCEVDGTPLVDDPAFEVAAPGPDLAAATHRGRAHQVDEDAYALDRRELDGLPLHVIVVCDGISASSHGERAAASAARAALDAVLAAIDAPAPLDRHDALLRAVRVAHRAACAAGAEPVPGKDPSGTTLVAAVAHAGSVDVAWVGDSRAYLVRPAPADGLPAAALLTHDHSWLNEVVESGELTAAEAVRSPSAHALTRCLGPLEDPDPERSPAPSLAAVSDVAGSRLILCSDGLWNCIAGPAEMAALATNVPAAADACALALHLVRRGFARGGRDDVTAAVAFL